MEFLYWLGQQFSAEGAVGYQLWYASLAKPFFAPPSWVFGFAWSIIYPFIALALTWALYVWFTKKVSVGFVALFAVNLLLNLTFSATLLASENNVFISLHIIAILVTLLILETLAWVRSKILFWLLFPYLLWSAFATVLQVTITVLN